MKTELLTLSPKEFVRKTSPCSEGRVYLNRSPSMEIAWDKCKRAEWLVWCLGVLGATGFSSFARWCVKNQTWKLHVTYYKNRVALFEAQDRPLSAAILTACLVQPVNKRKAIAEIHRRWSNPFKTQPTTKKRKTQPSTKKGKTHE
jgi:hypothetical protein